MSEMTSYLGWKIDYGTPKGEPALMHPLSVHWRVFKNPVALAAGGVAAVLMEFADPRIRSGVWDHSTYKADPIGRSKRTGVAAMVGVYGPRSAARRVIQGVTNMHARVNGSTPGGRPYKALDPELLNWVAATAGYGMMMGFDRFVSPLTQAEKDRFFAEVDSGEGLYGVTYSPRSVDDFLAMARERESVFEPHPIVTEFLDIIQSGRAAPGLPRFLHRALARAAVSFAAPDTRQARDRARIRPHFRGPYRTEDRRALGGSCPSGDGAVGRKPAPWPAGQFPQSFPARAGAACCRRGIEHRSGTRTGLAGAGVAATGNRGRLSGHRRCAALGSSPHLA